MRVIAYSYCDPRLSPTELPVWGWEVDQVYQDWTAERPQLCQLLADALVQPPTYLLVRHWDDLGDGLPQMGQQLAALADLGVEVVAIAAQSTLTPTSPQAMLETLADLQQRQRSRRIRQGHAQNRIQAQPPPGRAPYGYRRGRDRYVIDRSTALVVKGFFDHFLLYGSLRGAVRQIEKRFGKKIAVSTGQRWLSHPVYRGDLAYGDGQVVTDTHPPILPRQEAAQIDRLLRRNRQLPRRSASAERSLAGLVTCQQCQNSLKLVQAKARRRQKVYRYFSPTVCPRQRRCRGIPYDALLDKTITAICTQLPAAVAQRFGTENDAGMDGVKGAIAAQIDQKQQVLAQLPALLQQGILDRTTTDLRTYSLRTEIAQLQQQLAQLPPVNLQATAKTVSIPQFWLDLSEVERRFYLREFIRQIHIIRPAEDAPDSAWDVHLAFMF